MYVAFETQQVCSLGRKQSEQGRICCAGDLEKDYTTKSSGRSLKTQSQETSPGPWQTNAADLLHSAWCMMSKLYPAEVSRLILEKFQYDQSLCAPFSHHSWVAAIKVLIANRMWVLLLIKIWSVYYGAIRFYHSFLILMDLGTLVLLVIILTRRLTFLGWNIYP